MTKHLVIYEFANHEHQDFEDVPNAILELDEFAVNVFANVWITSPGIAAEDIRAKLEGKFDSGDKVLIAELSGEFQSLGLTDDDTTWLSRNQ